MVQFSTTLIWYCLPRATETQAELGIHTCARNNSIFKSGRWHTAWLNNLPFLNLIHEIYAVQNVFPRILRLKHWGMFGRKADMHVLERKEESISKWEPRRNSTRTERKPTTLPCKVKVTRWFNSIHLFQLQNELKHSLLWCQIFAMSHCDSLRTFILWKTCFVFMQEIYANNRPLFSENAN